MKSARLVSLATVVLLLLGWEAVSELEWLSPMFLPSPSRVLHQFVVLSRDGYAGATLWEHAGTSLLRILCGFAVAASAAIPIGLLMGTNRWIKGALDPVIEFYWPLPPLAYLPLMIIWIGIDEAAKVTLLGMAMFAPICLAAQAGVRSVPIERIHAAQSLGASRRQLFFYILLPSALPEIMTGIRISIGTGWATLVAAELIAATEGIGFMIMSAANFLATDIVFAGIITIAVCALASAAAARWAERLLVPWKGKS